MYHDLFMEESSIFKLPWTKYLLQCVLGMEPTFAEQKLILRQSPKDRQKWGMSIAEIQKMLKPVEVLESMNGRESIKKGGLMTPAFQPEYKVHDVTHKELTYLVVDDLVAV